MANPFNTFIGEARETIVIAIIAIIAFIILGTMGIAFRMQEFTNQIINSISWGVLLYLALPSTAFIIFIIWAVNKIMDNVNPTYHY